MNGNRGFATSMVVLCAVIWGFIGVITRNLLSLGFDPLQITAIRMGVCAMAILLLVILFDRSSLKIARKDLWVFVLFGVVKTVSDLLLFLAQSRINISLSTVLQMTSPYWVIVFSAFLLSEKITLKTVCCVIVAAIGCVLVTGILEEELSFDTIGILAALGSGIMFALYSVGTKIVINKGYSPNTGILYMFLFGTICIVPFTDNAEILTRSVAEWDVLFNVLMMGIVMSLVTFKLQSYGLKHLEAGKVAIILLLEIVVATFVGILLYNEVLSALNIIGTILVPLSILFMNLDIGGKSESGSS